jgi:hypothetical protein
LVVVALGAQTPLVLAAIGDLDLETVRRAARPLPVSMSQTDMVTRGFAIHSFQEGVTPCCAGPIRSTVLQKRAFASVASRASGPLWSREGTVRASCGLKRNSAPSLYVSTINQYHE